MKYWTQEELSTLGVWELRYIARGLGMSSPTTKKRHELLTGIMDIQNGVVKPVIRKTRLGRALKSFEEPPVDFSTTNTSASGFDVPDIVFNSKYVEYDNDSQNQTYKLDGFLAKELVDYCFLSFDNPMAVETVAVLNEQFVRDNGLKIGDYCFFEATKNANLIDPVVQKVESINSIKYNDFSRKVFQGLKVSFLKEPIAVKLHYDCTDKVFDVHMCHGDRVIAFGNANAIQNNFICQTCECLEDDMQKVLILIGATPEQVNYFQQSFKGLVLFSLYTDSPYKQKYLYNIAIEHCKHLVANGNKVVLFVDNLAQLNKLSTVPVFMPEDKKVGMGELFSLARRMENDGALTVIGCIENQHIGLVSDLANSISKTIDTDSF